MRKKKYVRASYLFSSMAEREGSQLSDIDIAAFIDDKLGRAERNRRKILLISAISSILKTDRIDLVIYKVNDW
ncbi:MAG: nucleotidyltransferase domain-containing protein [Candidatus Aenigmarchaeota archaeon]|nr:nucleotidyltransferase domain-containing protein [Candidatus Aenigmarchaeota archaeon]